VTIAPPPPNLDLVLADESLLARALQALLETAVKFSKKGTTVQLTSDLAATAPTLMIESHGSTIPAPALEKIFDLFSIGEAITSGGDLGVGLPLAYRVLSLFGASLAVANRESSGIRMTISLRKAVPLPFIANRKSDA